MTAHHPSAISAQLGLRPGIRVWVGGHSLSARRAVAVFLADTVHPPTGPLDAAFITPDTPEEANYFMNKLRDRLVPQATTWIISPDALPCAHGRVVSLDETYSAWAVRPT